MISRGWIGPAAVLVCALGAPALAQMNNVSPYYAVVAADDAALRCGSSDSIGLLNSMYQVAKLQRGQLLKVDGEAQGWTRVSYPSGSYAFVPSDCAQADASARFVTLTKAFRPKAANLAMGLRGSWKDCLEQALPVGTKLNLAEAEAAVNGANTAYKVVPPEGARAFIPSSAIRKATQEEIDAFNAMAAKGGAPAPAPGTPALGAAPQAKPGPQPVAPPAVNPTLLNPNSMPATTAQAPAGAQPGSPATVASPEIKPLEIKPSPYEKLEAAFEAVRKQPPDSGEFSELLAEFQSALEKVKPEESGARMVRARLQQRIDYLKLLADMQSKQREFAAGSESVAQDEKKLKERLAEVDRVRQYTIVGRLSASTIYDGKRLPLMYRVQAVGGTAPRTLAYVKPSEELKVESKIGQVVGVVGEARMDPTLKLNIITPLRVDPLEPASLKDAAAPAETPAKDAGPKAEPKADPKEEPKPEPKEEPQ
jgi:hypothetical protein